MKEDGSNGASDPADWMSILRMDKKDLNNLAKRVNLKYDADYPIRDPTQRLNVTLRYLATGEGFHVDLSETFYETYHSIFVALESNMEVSL